MEFTQAATYIDTDAFSEYNKKFKKYVEVDNIQFDSTGVHFSITSSGEIRVGGSYSGYTITPQELLQLGRLIAALYKGVDYEALDKEQKEKALNQIDSVMYRGIQNANTAIPSKDNLDKL